MIIHPYADVDNLAACCQQMRSPNLKRMYVIVDSRTAVTQTQSFLETLSASLEGVEVVVRFATPAYHHANSSSLATDAGLL